jgi:toxin-antitoxin system PIN domain toxin
MPLADSNVWLALALSKHQFHSAAKGWLKKRSPKATALFCRSTQQSFLRLLTTTAVMSPYGVLALSNRVAWTVYEGFVADDRIAWAGEPSGLEPLWKKLAGSPKASPKLWMDAYLAAFAIAGGHQLVTTDKAFEHFKGLDVLVLAKS